MIDYTPDNDLATLGLGDERSYVEKAKFARLKKIFDSQYKVEDGRPTTWIPTYGERVWIWCYHSEFVPLWAGTRMKLGLFPPLSIYRIIPGASSDAVRENEVVAMVKEYEQGTRLVNGKVCKNKTAAVEQVALVQKLKDERVVWQYLKSYADRSKQMRITIMPGSKEEFEILKDYILTNYKNQRRLE